jgi:hypothetical protein
VPSGTPTTTAACPSDRTRCTPGRPCLTSRSNASGTAATAVRPASAVGRNSGRRGEAGTAVLPAVKRAEHLDDVGLLTGQAAAHCRGVEVGDADCGAIPLLQQRAAGELVGHDCCHDRQRERAANPAVTRARMPHGLDRPFTELSYRCRGAATRLRNPGRVSRRSVSAPRVLIRVARSRERWGPSRGGVVRLLRWARNRFWFLPTLCAILAATLPTGAGTSSASRRGVRPETDRLGPDRVAGRPGRLVPARAPGVLQLRSAVRRAPQATASPWKCRAAAELSAIYPRKHGCVAVGDLAASADSAVREEGATL